jgi:hypothetical protein
LFVTSCLPFQAFVRDVGLAALQRIDTPRDTRQNKVQLRSGDAIIRKQQLEQLANLRPEWRVAGRQHSNALTDFKTKQSIRNSVSLVVIN